jgi:hypothetical protein
MFACDTHPALGVETIASVPVSQRETEVYSFSLRKLEIEHLLAHSY